MASVQSARLYFYPQTRFSSKTPHAFLMSCFEIFGNADSRSQMLKVSTSRKLMYIKHLSQELIKLEALPNMAKQQLLLHASTFSSFSPSILFGYAWRHIFVLKNWFFSGFMWTAFPLEYSRTIQTLELATHHSQCK